MFGGTQIRHSSHHTHDHLSGKSLKVGSGGPTVLTSSEERDIALTCMALADMGYGLTRDVVAEIVCDYLHENAIANSFTDEVPGKDW